MPIIPPLGWNELLIIVIVLLLLGGTTFARRLGQYFGGVVRGFMNRLESVSEDNDRSSARNWRETGSDDVCYRLLGLTPSATKEEIKAAYRRKAKQHHPDRNGDREVMEAITRAYEHLMGKK